MLRSSAVVNYVRPSLQTLRRNYSAAAAVQPVVEIADEPVQEQGQTPRNLSARLGGSGRGKRTDDTVDPFSAFLQEARQNRRSNMNRQNNNNNNNNRRNAQRKPQQQAAPGQFDDAVEETAQPQQNNNRNFKNKNRNNNNRNTNNRPSQRASGTNDRRQPDQRRQKRGPVMGASSATGPARRVTTFIDKDLDWSAMSSFAGVETGPLEVGESNEVVAELKQGEYARYLDLTDSLSWAPGVDQSALSSLVGGNASYSLEQKAAFLNAISSATASSSPAPAAKQ